MIANLIALVLSLILKVWDAVKPTPSEKRRSDLQSIEAGVKDADEFDTEKLSKEIGKRL